MDGEESIMIVIIVIVTTTSNNSGSTIFNVTISMVWRESLIYS